MTATRELQRHRVTTVTEYGVQTSSGTVLVVTQDLYAAHAAAVWVVGGRVVERHITTTDWR